MSLYDEPRQLLIVEVAILVALTGIFWFVGGFTGFGVGAVISGTWFIAGTWFDLRSVYIYAAGQLLAVPLLIEGAELRELVAIEVGLACFLGVSLLSQWSSRTKIITILIFTTATVTLSLVRFVDRLLAAVALLFAIYMIVAYGLHRYEINQLDLGGLYSE